MATYRLIIYRPAPHDFAGYVIGALLANATVVRAPVRAGWQSTNEERARVVEALSAIEAGERSWSRVQFGEAAEAESDEAVARLVGR